MGATMSAAADDNDRLCFVRNAWIVGIADPVSTLFGMRPTFDRIRFNIALRHVDTDTVLALICR